MSEVQAPDFSRLALKPSERLAIVQYVHGTANLQETEYLEWKSAYDLKSRPGAALTARQLIGMANRDSAHAARHAEGHAYVLIGVEPGNVPGVPQWDSSDVENWLARFVGADLRYDIHYVSHEGQEVLFLTIDAPRDGDPIYNLQKASSDPATEKSLDAGTIYVRHGSNTEPASPEDIQRLTARANTVSATALDLSVELDASKVAVIDPQLLADEYRDAKLASWRSEMLSALPGRQSGLNLALADVRTLAERRTPSEYTSEVDLYVQTVRSAHHYWWGIMAEEWLEAGHSVLSVSVVNHSEDNYENTVVELTFSLPRFCVYLRSYEVEDVIGLPDKPSKWGDTLADIPLPRRGLISQLKDPEPEIERIDKNETLVRYPELRVRPHTTHALKPPLFLALGPPMAGTVVPVHWRVTTSSTKSDQSGDIELKVPGGPAQREEDSAQAAVE